MITHIIENRFNKYPYIAPILNFSTVSYTMSLQFSCFRETLTSN